MRNHGPCGETAWTLLAHGVRGARGVARTHYPRFIFGGGTGRDVPVFIYHDVDAARFAEDLEFLRVNGYRTLSLAEFLHPRCSRRSRERTVLLTFDDARRSFWTDAFPTLRAAGARATVFVPSAWPERPGAAHLFVSWSELRECRDSGLIDVQSHAHRHALVHVTDRVQAFATPAGLERYDLYDWPMRERAGVEELGAPALGTPVYGAAPLLSAQRRFIEHPAVLDACVRLIERSGARQFFADPDWAARLRAEHKKVAAHRPGHFATPAELRRSVLRELEQASAVFEERLGERPSAIAYPWMLGTRESLEIARQLRFTCAFGVALDFGRTRDQPIAVHGRYKADWLRLLPGRGRQRLWRVGWRKLSAAGRLRHLAHGP